MKLGVKSGSQADAGWKRFQLTGRSVALDRRFNAMRGDLSDVALAVRYVAPHYSCPQTFSLTAPRVAIRSKAHMSSTAISELLHGEMFQAIDIAGGWAWGYCVHDHYVGYIPVDTLGKPVLSTHLVTAAAALVFAEPNIKSPAKARLPMGSRVSGEVEGAFLKRSEEQTSELQSLMRISYAVFCLKKKINQTTTDQL